MAVGATANFWQSRSGRTQARALFALGGVRKTKGRRQLCANAALQVCPAASLKLRKYQGWCHSLANT